MLKYGWMIAVVGMMVAVAGAQMPGQGAGPGFGEHRPPMERAFGPQGDHGRWWNDAKIVERLKLTEVQRKSMDAIMQAHRETLVDLRASLEKAELALEPLMNDDQPNEGRILAQIDRVAQARAELEKANARFLLAIRSKLTPEQWKQMQADRAEHELRHRNGGPGGPGAASRPGSGKLGPRQGGAENPPPPGAQGRLDEPGADGFAAPEAGAML